MKAQKQNIVSVSESAMQFIKDCTCDFSTPYADESKGNRPVTLGEVVDGMVSLVETSRWQEREETDDDGNVSLVEFDALGEAIAEAIAAKTRAPRTSATKALQSEVERLKAQLAALQGATDA